MLRQKTVDNYNKIEQYSKRPGVTEDHIISLIKHLCREDMQLFSLIFFSEHNRFPHNRFHCEAYDVLEDRSKKKIVRAAARGLAKSSVFTVVNVIHSIVYRTYIFTVIFSRTEPLALGHSENIIRELQTNRKLISCFGLLLPGARVSAGKFECQNSVMVQAYGRGAAVRGLKYGSYRPDQLILDDVEDKESATNPDTNAKNHDWYREEISFLGTKDTRILFVGTPLAQEALLMSVQKMPKFDSRVYPMVEIWDAAPELWAEWEKIYTNKDNPDHLLAAKSFYETHKEKMIEGVSVIWPESESYLDLKERIIEIGMPSFLQEYQMEPLDLSKVLFSKFSTFSWDSDPRWGRGIKTAHGQYIPLRSFNVEMSIDPTAGAKDPRKGDATSIVLAYTEIVGVRRDERRMFIFRDWTRNAKPSEWIEMVFTLAAEYKVERIVVEENLFKNFLKENMVAVRDKMVKEGKLRQEGIPKIKTVLSSRNKEARIIQLEPKISSGAIQFLDNGLSPEFWNQLKLYAPNGKCKDDVPDAIEMLWENMRGFGSGSVSDFQLSNLPR